MKYLPFLLLFFTPLIADENGCIDSCECCDGPLNAVVSLRHKEPGGIGYRKGYTSVDLFTVPCFCPNHYMFVDVRGHIFNDGKWASNFGLGYRKLAECSDAAWGANLYWDWRETDHYHYHQLGVGLEAIWPCWDLRINGYYPFGSRKRAFKTGFDRFEGNSAFLFKRYDLALWGADAGVGYTLFRTDYFSLHTTLGGYYFRGDFRKHAGGGLLRGKLDVTEWMSIEGQASYDSLFKWQGYGELALHVPCGNRIARYPRKTACCENLISIEEKLSTRPERFEIIVSTQEKQTAKALHPIINLPLTFYFVDNTSSSNGTFESPFSTMAAAEAASSKSDAIYVFPGNAPYSAMTTLKDQQILAGSGGPLEVQSRFGLIEIPTQTTALPKLTAVTDTIFLANQNSISGLAIEATSGFSLRAMDPINSLSLAHNQIFANSPAGVALGLLFSDDFTGTLQVRSNSFSVNGDEAMAVFILGGAVNGDWIFENNAFNIFGTTEAIGIEIGGLFTGTFSSKENNLRVQSSNRAFGIVGTNPFQGGFTSERNQITINAGTSDAYGIVFFDDFSGSFIEKNDILSVTADEETFGVSIMGTFSNNFTLANTSISAVSRNNLAVATRFTDFNGNFLAQSNAITADSQTIGNNGFGIEFMNSLIGNFTALNNQISVIGHTAVGIDCDLFTGNWNAINNNITVSGIDLVIGMALTDTFTGNFRAENNQILTSAVTEAIGINFFTSFNGTMTGKNNIITSNATMTTAGWTSNTLMGNFTLEGNEITTSKGFSLFTPSSTNSFMTIEKNHFIQTETSSVPTVDIGVSGTDLIVQDNLFSHPLGTGFALGIIHTASTTNLQFLRNTMFAPEEIADGIFDNMSGTFNMESPNGAQSGVEGANTGRMSFIDVTFIPLE